jgi:acyl-CoA synthetase (AMP-forming)/AMP-acid ligase II
MYYPVTHATGLLEGLGLLAPDRGNTLAFQFERHAAQRPQQIFLLFEDEHYTYAEANALINRHAHAYRALGVGKGHVVALMFENRPEFLWHIFALHKLGAIASLINSQLQGEPLAHAIRICRPRHAVIGSEAWSSFSGVRDRLRDVAVDAVDVDLDPRSEHAVPGNAWGARLNAVSHADPGETGSVVLSDQASFIYTSGTTGLPKAAIVSHDRMYRAGQVWAGLAFVCRSGDVLYNCLPLYHSNAILLAVGSVVSAGVTLALSRKFSRTRFWDEIRQHDASGFVYIGELCRYLMNNEPAPAERDHRVRVISGNGLRPDIWRAFQKRCGVARIAEFYAATESNCVTINVLGLVGAVGPRLPGMALVRWDEQNASFARDAAGHLVRVAIGEPGVLLGRIRRGAGFDGYEDKRATEHKIIRNGFEAGDAWFNTGDLLRMDHLWHLYFVDRLGDTFRWKGENVATSEVEEQLAQWEPVREVNVYGVSVPGSDGRAGMAALVLRPGQEFDAARMRDYVEQRLPSYARPRLVRIVSALGTTSTFKVKKSELQNEGYDPRALNEPLYVLHPALDAYVALTGELYDALAAGQLRL